MMKAYECVSEMLIYRCILRLQIHSPLASFIVMLGLMVIVSVQLSHFRVSEELQRVIV